MKFKWKHIKTDYNEKTHVGIKIDGKYTSCQREIAKKYIAHIVDKIDNANYRREICPELRSLNKHETKDYFVSAIQNARMWNKL